ncbi:His Kinase A (phospho-acceptor) domain-containing protein [Bosea sp. CRIB-10]|uniref:PAS domain-containing protein n=1 Tax=Bosea sp. CRIB-10 TaxID=378404 RepID=UPI0008EE75E5|nr:PAS domain-containing protein [Bosea sp. CRIB-10]SFD18915.1 His Kinase A (phospho-acceptor) domain-containing protein [Bosea sp. CRIB-10]
MHSDAGLIAPILTQMFEQAPTFMALLRGPEHRFDLANPSYLRLIGDREVVGRTVAEALPDAVAQGVVGILDDVYRTGVPYAANGARFVIQAEPGGPTQERFLDFVYQPLRDSDGKVNAIFIEGADVTERTLAERARRESEALYRGLFDAIDEGFCIIEFFDGPHGPDSDYVHIQANAAYERHAGIPNVVGQKLREMVPDEADAWVARYGAVLRTGEPIRFQQELVATGRYLDLAAVRIDPPSRRQVAVIFQDITARRKAEIALAELNATLEQEVEKRSAELMKAEEALRQSQKMEAVGQLTGGIAHDFNNILAGIGGSLEMAQARIAQGRIADVERFLTGAKSAVRRAASLTERLLAFSRRQTLDPRPVNVNTLVNGMLDLIARSVGPTIAIEAVGAAGLWTVFADAGQLENALLNLCINSRDAMPDGGRLTIETSNRWMDERAAKARDLKPGQYVSLCVSDTGTGMAAEVVERAFDPFFTTKPIGQGTGLGLSMVYGFAGQSGGAARIYSEPGKGTMICIYLPRHMGEVVEAGEAATDSVVPAPAAGGETILVVDDEPLVRMLVVEQLEELGYAVIEADDGPSAMRIIDSKQPIDLLVTDVGLPRGMNGRQLADAARQRRPGLEVLFVTGYAENAVLNHGHLEPGMHIMTKPFEMEIFAQRVRDLIDRRREAKR